MKTLGMHLDDPVSDSPAIFNSITGALSGLHWLVWGGLIRPPWYLERYQVDFDRTNAIRFLLSRTIWFIKNSSKSSTFWIWEVKISELVGRLRWLNGVQRVFGTNGWINTGNDTKCTLEWRLYYNLKRNYLVISQCVGRLFLATLQHKKGLRIGFIFNKMSLIKK